MAVSAEIRDWIAGLERELQIDPAHEEQLLPLKLKQDVLCLKPCFDEICEALTLLASETDAPEEASLKLETLQQLAGSVLGSSSLSFEQAINRFLSETKSLGVTSRDKDTGRSIHLRLKEEDGLKPTQEVLSFEDYWTQSLQDGEVRPGDGHSDTRTIDLVEKTDDFNLKQRARTLLNLLFEAWRQQRATLLEQVERKLIPAHRAQTRIANLFWGKEREDAAAKTKVKETFAKDKQQAVDLLVKKKLLASNFAHDAVAGLARHLVDKLDRVKAEDKSKFSAQFTSFCDEVTGFLAVFTHETQTQQLMDELKPKLLAKFEKRMLDAVDALLDSFSAVLQHFKLALVKGQSVAMVEVPDTDWHWSAKEEDRLAYSECLPMRENFSQKYPELHILDRKPKPRKPRQGRSSLPKFWDSKFAPQAKPELAHLKNLRQFLVDFFSIEQSATVFHRHGIVYNSEAHLSAIYVMLFTFLQRMVRDAHQTESLAPESPTIVEEVSYLLMTVEQTQLAFLTVLPAQLAASLESDHCHFHNLKEKLTTTFITGSKKTWSELLLLGIMEQNWMISQRLFRTPNLAFKVESTESENLYCVWLFICRKVRTMARVYREAKLPLHHMLVPVLKLYLEFFSEAFEVVAATTTSVQRQELFSRDVKLLASLIESVVPLTNNVTEQQSADGGLQYTVRFPRSTPVNPLDYVVLVRKLQLLRGHLRFLHASLSANGKGLVSLVQSVWTGLFKNRQAVSKNEDVQRSAQGFLEQMKRETARHAACVREL